MDSKLWFLLILYLIVVIILVFSTYYLLKGRRSGKLKRRISNFTTHNEK